MPQQPKRPLGITLLALPFLWIGGLGTPIFFLMAVTGGAQEAVGQLVDGMGLTPTQSTVATFLGCTVWLVGYVFYAWIGYGLWKLRLTQLKTVIVLQWIGLIAFAAVSLFVLLSGSWTSALWTFSIGCSLPGSVLFYLRRPTTRWPFEATFAASRQLPIPELSEPARQPMSWKRGAVIGGMMLLVGAGAVGITFSIEHSIRNSPPYMNALSEARNSPCVAKAIGTPFIQKGHVTGTLSTGEGTTTDLEIPIRGPRGEGSLHAVVTQRKAVWSFTDLTLYFSNGQVHLYPVTSSCP